MKSNIEHYWTFVKQQIKLSLSIILTLEMNLMKRKDKEKQFSNSPITLFFP